VSSFGSFAARPNCSGVWQVLLGKHCRATAPQKSGASRDQVAAGHQRAGMQERVAGEGSTACQQNITTPKRKLKEATSEDDWEQIPESHARGGLPSEFRKRGGAASKDARPDDKRCTPSVLQRQSSALGQAPPDVSDLNAVIVIEEQDDARKECSAKGGEEVRPGGAEVRATGTPKGRGQSPDAAEQVQRVKEADNGHAVASGGKRAKGAGATPGCCWKCGATKSTDWLALYVDGLPHQLCKGCQVYHKDNRIVVDALLPEEADAQEAGDCEFGHPSNLRTRAQQRAPEHQGIAHAADITMDGSQIYACSAQDSGACGLIAGKCKSCGVRQSKAWYDDGRYQPLSLCANCHQKRQRLPAASPRKRCRAEGEGVTFSADECSSSKGACGARGRNKTPKIQRPAHAAAASAHAESDGEESHEESETEAGYGCLMMSQAFGDDAHQDDDNNDEYGPSDEEEQEEEQEGGLFAGHAFLLTGVEVEEKRSLKKQIESEGGELVDCNSIEPGKEPSKLLLLTSAPCKTSNFLCGLAVGVCVVSTQWVADCLSSKQVCPVDSYRLDAAFDTRTRERTKVPKHFGSRPLDLAKRVLAGKLIAIIGNKPFHHDHTRMLRFAGAQLVHDILDSAATLHYIICESWTKFRPTSRQISSAHARNIPMVNSEWLCACVRQQKLVNTTDYRVEHLAHGARIRLSYAQSGTGASAPTEPVKMMIAGLG